MEDHPHLSCAPQPLPLGPEGFSEFLEQVTGLGDEESRTFRAVSPGGAGQSWSDSQMAVSPEDRPPEARPAARAPPRGDTPWRWGPIAQRPWPRSLGRRGVDDAPGR